MLRSSFSLLDIFFSLIRIPFIAFVTLTVLVLKISQIYQSGILNHLIQIPPLFAEKPNNIQQDIDSTKGKAEKDVAKHQFSPLDLEPSEMMILYSLSRKRQQLERREKNQEIHEALVLSVEKRISQKIEELSKIRQEIKDIYDKIQEYNDETTKNLVQIFEKMKPKDAAKIFEEMKEEIAVPILGKMKPKNTSNLFAKLTQERAQRYTFLLAEQRKFLDLPSSKN